MSLLPDPERKPAEIDPLLGTQPILNQALKLETARVLAAEVRQRFPSVPERLLSKLETVSSAQLNQLAKALPRLRTLSDLERRLPK